MVGGGLSAGRRPLNALGGSSWPFSACTSLHRLCSPLTGSGVFRCDSEFWQKYLRYIRAAPVPELNLPSYRSGLFLTPRNRCAPCWLGCLGGSLSVGPMVPKSQTPALQKYLEVVLGSLQHSKASASSLSSLQCSFPVPSLSLGS